MTAPSFAVNWDYRCPFARIAHEHVVVGLLDGADWDVQFVPFSLSQAKVGDGEPDVWDDPRSDSGLRALQVGVAVRDLLPDRFPAVHRALFDLRHVHGGDLRSDAALRGVLQAEGVDADAVFDEVESGLPLETIRKEHEASVVEHDVWGVPTFMAHGQAAFVRLMERPVDAADARRSVERIVTLLTGWPELNEFKHTSLPR